MLNHKLKYIILVIFLLIIILLFNNKVIENFYTTDGTQVATADPLELEKYHIFDPTGWRCGPNNTLVNIIKIKAITGQIDFEDIMAIPTLGYHSNSGLEYSSWNKLQGTNGWTYLNEARHGHGWFWWMPTVRWQKLSDDEKRQEVEIKIVLNNDLPQRPEFPVAYALKIQDFNYNHSMRFWLTLTHDPIVHMSHPCDQSDIARHTLSPPLLLKHTNIVIDKKLWKINKNIATTKVTLDVQQGGIDWKNIEGDFKINGKTNNEYKNKWWFSWDTNYESDLHSPIKVVLHCKINNIFPPPKHFPVIYTIKIKDKHMERYIYVKLKILENPFTYEYNEPTTELSKQTATNKIIIPSGKFIPSFCPSCG